MSVPTPGEMKKQHPKQHLSTKQEPNRRPQKRNSKPPKKVETPPYSRLTHRPQVDEQKLQEWLDAFNKVEIPALLDELKEDYLIKDTPGLKELAKKLPAPKPIDYKRS